MKDKWVISCVNHKTGVQGRGTLVVDKDDLDHLNDYYRLVRQFIVPKRGCEKYFFLTYRGSQYKGVYLNVVEIICTNQFNCILPPPPKDHRVVLCTKTARINDGAMRCKVNHHLCQSDQSSSNYYAFTV